MSAYEEGKRRKALIQRRMSKKIKIIKINLLSQIQCSIESDKELFQRFHAAFAAPLFARYALCVLFFH